MSGILLSSLSLLLFVQGLSCLRIRELRVPTHVAEGSEAVLGCKFDLHGQRLYSVKWLKDEQEFYHYKPGSNSTDLPRVQAFPQRGVTVDLARSSMSWVVLVYMGRESAGEYRCEVTGEAPHFKKVYAKRNVSVDLLPETEPHVQGLREHYAANQPLEANCTCAGARPECQVKWLVNGAPAPRYHLRGPWLSRGGARVDAADTTLELRFGVMSSHYIQGVMTLTCQATLPPLYQKEVVFRYRLLPRAGQGRLLETTTQHDTPNTTEDPCTSTIRIEIEPPNYSLLSDTDGAVFMCDSLLILILCILFQVIL